MPVSNFSISGIKTITAVAGNWYRVKGTRDEPVLEKVVLWAVVTLTLQDSKSGADSGDGGEMIVGIPAKDFSLHDPGDFEEWAVGVAGYLELSADDLDAISEKPMRIRGYADLTWGEDE